jgi:hypothetical protein
MNRSCYAFVIVMRYDCGTLGRPVTLVRMVRIPILALFARPLEFSQTGSRRKSWRFGADDREGDEMKRHMCARGLLVGAISVTALAASTGIAHADSDPFSSPTPGIIDFLVENTPALYVDPADEGGPAVNWDGVGMYCQNLFMRCRESD